MVLQSVARWKFNGREREKKGGEWEAEREGEREGGRKRVGEGVRERERETEKESGSESVEYELDSNCWGNWTFDRHTEILSLSLIFPSLSLSPPACLN